ncbi:MAG: hypothetical protein ACD_22C00047G0010 [uncultured bacterium]|nr:MAG: hypothetical protein ACD_22C00047G0010 [uncultured bacterium]
MNKNAFIITITVSVMVIALSVFYYLVILPIHTSNELGRCLKRAEAHPYEKLKQDYRDNCFKQFK